MRTFDFYFDFESPFAYLASTQIAKICAETHAICTYRPIFLGAVMRATGNRPPANVPAKGKYLMGELETWKAIFTVPLAWPKHFPLGSHLRPIRGATYAFTRGDAQGIAYTDALYRAHWGDQRDVKDDAVIREIAEAASLDFDTLDEAVRSDAIKSALREETDAFVARGGFGVPAFYAGEAMYWGVDKLPWLLATLRGDPLGLPRCDSGS